MNEKEITGLLNKLSEKFSGRLIINRTDTQVKVAVRQPDSQGDKTICHDILRINITPQTNNADVTD